MRLIDANRLLQQIEELEQRKTESADSFTGPSGFRAIEFNRLKDYIDDVLVPIGGDMRADTNRKENA